MDDSKISALEEASERHTSFAEWGAKALIIGLAIELVYVAISDRSWFERLILGVANVLVTGGVGAEVYFARRARSADDKLRAEAKTRLTEALNRAAHAEEELIKFRARRSISPEAMKEISESLKSFAPMRFDICVSSPDQEYFGLLDQIMLVCLWAGWEWIDWPILGGVLYASTAVRHGGKHIGVGGAFLNVTIGHRFDAPPETRGAAEAFAAALFKSGVGAAAETLSAGAPTIWDAQTVHIRIGRKT